VTDQTYTWLEAEGYAQGLGGHLVTINDASEQAFVEDRFSWWEPYTGLNDVDHDDVWTWSSGEAVTCTNWVDGPDSASAAWS